MIIQHHNNTTYLIDVTLSDLDGFCQFYLIPSTSTNVKLKLSWYDIDGCDGGSVIISDVRLFCSTLHRIIKKHPYIYSLIIKKGD